MKFINKQELHKLFAELKMNKQEDVFNELYNECSNLVYRIAFSILKNNILDVYLFSSGVCAISSSGKS